MRKGLYQPHPFLSLCVEAPTGSAVDQAIHLSLKGNPVFRLRYAQLSAAGVYRRKDKHHGVSGVLLRTSPALKLSALNCERCRTSTTPPDLPSIALRSRFHVSLGNSYAHDHGLHVPPSFILQIQLQIHQ